VPDYGTLIEKTTLLRTGAGQIADWNAMGTDLIRPVTESPNESKKAVLNRVSGRPYNAVSQCPHRG